MQCEFNAKKNQNQIEKRKKGEKIGSLCDPLACNLPLVYLHMKIKAQDFCK
jgi:hypothetical protein